MAFHRCCYGVFHVFFQCLCPEPDRPSPAPPDLILNASKGVAYFVDPLWYKDIQIVAGAQEIGEIGLRQRPTLHRAVSMWSPLAMTST